MFPWLDRLNFFLVITLVLVISFGFFLYTKVPEHALTIAPPHIINELPQSPFIIPDSSRPLQDDTPFSLKWVSPKMQLPDLRKQLIFYGKNERPDADDNSILLAIKGSDTTIFVQEGEKVYLSYLASAKMGNNKVFQNDQALVGEIPDKMRNLSYAFCESGISSLWLEVKLTNDDSLDVKVYMLDENKMLVATPTECHSFFLAKEDFPKNNLSALHLGKFHVDSTLLVRQKARWLGTDVFLQLHGGEEYLFAKDKQKIDFTEGSNPHSCFVAEGDFLIWKDDQWKMPAQDEDTQCYPILLAKKIDDRIMSLELWAENGKGKLSLNLIRTRDMSGFPNIQSEFKFVGVKTFAQFIVECRNERMTLRPHDWLVLTPQGWHKIDSAASVDDYVDGKLTGPLFVLEKLVRQNGRSSLVGHLFNSTRTNVQNVELDTLTAPSIASLNLPLLPPPVMEKTLEDAD